MTRRALPWAVRAAFVAAAFAVPASAWREFWPWIAPDVLNRIGYGFWLISSTEGIAYVARMNLVRVVLQYATPLLLGAVAAGWTWKRLRPKR